MEDVKNMVYSVGMKRKMVKRGRILLASLNDIFLSSWRFFSLNRKRKPVVQRLIYIIS